MKNFLLIPAAPFAGAPYIQDYLDNMQNYSYLVKENKEKKQEALNNAKGNK